MLCELPVRLGATVRGEACSLDLVAQSASILVQGRSRSGKTALVESVIAQAVKHPEVVIAGCDPSAILLHPARHLAHPEWRATGGATMRPHADALAALVNEMDRRIGLLLSRGIDKISVFSVDEPLILVVLEEYPALRAAAEDEDAMEGRRLTDRCAPRIRRGAARLAREALKCGIRILAVTQRADAEIIGGNERSNYASRITLAMDNPDGVKMLHPYATPDEVEAAHRFPPGTGFVESPDFRLTRVTFDRFNYCQYRAALAAR